jgi:molybdenum cofactor synthesis domain-containing protein
MPSASEGSAPTAAVLVIGNEILSGRTQDTNTGWIGAKLAERGVRLREARTVPDIEAEIVAALRALSGRYDYVFTTGGIGPTHDDITAESVAKAYDLPLVTDPEAVRRLERHYGAGKVTPARLRMARVPQGAALIENVVSGAPGFHIGNVFVMAGVPAIMRAMLDGILPTLANGPKILQRIVETDTAESVLAEGLGQVQGAHPTVDIGSYPWFREGKAGVSLVARGADAAQLDQVAQDIVRMIGTLGGTAEIRP